MTNRADIGQPSVPEGVLGIDKERRGPCLIFHLRGDIDFETAQRLRNVVLTAVDAAKPPHFVLDLGEVAYCDSSGMSALVSIWKAARAAAGTVILAQVPEQTRRMLSYTGLDSHLTLSETVPDAIADMPV